MLYITHPAPGHLDEVLGGAVIKATIPGATILRKPLDEALETPGVALIFDMGATIQIKEHGSGAPTILDHHHNSELPCAAALIVDWLGIPVSGHGGAIKELSQMDTQGVWSLPEDARPDPILYQALIEAESLWWEDHQAAQFLVETFLSATSLKEAVEAVFTNAPEEIRPELEAARARVIERRSAIPNPEIVWIPVPHGEAAVGILKNTPQGGMIGEIFATHGVDILVFPNPREADKVSIVRDSAGRFGQVPIGDLLPDMAMKASFIHPSGFMMVVPGSPDTIIQSL